MDPDETPSIGSPVLAPTTTEITSMIELLLARYIWEDPVIEQARALVQRMKDAEASA
jgi:hypothetical protein